MRLDRFAMRVLLVGNANSVHLVKIANSMAEHGFTIAIATLHGQSHELSSAVQVYDLGKIYKGLGYFKFRTLQKIELEFKPDVVNSHYATGYGLLASRSKCARRVVSVWGSDVLLFPKKSIFHRSLVKAILRKYTHCFSTSKIMIKEVKKLRGDIPVSLTPFGVNTELFVPGPEVKPDAGKVVIFGTVRSLKKVYGIDRLIVEFAEAERLLKKTGACFPPLRLRIVGGGAERGNLEALVSKLGISDSVEFIGAVPNDRIPSILQEMDIFVALSRSESFGVAVIEAQACALPVVVSDVGGLPEVVVDGCTGVIVPEKNIPDARQNFIELILDEELRLKMGRAGRKFVCDNFSLERTTMIYIKEIKKVANTGWYR